MKLESTKNTPFIELNGNGDLSFVGRSIPENPNTFYSPVLKWINSYSEKPCSKTTLNLEFDYINTSSSKCLLEVFESLNTLKGKSDLQVNWKIQSDDEDMVDLAKEFEKLLELPINQINI